MTSGNVELLLVAGVNPAYDGPSALKFADALANPEVSGADDNLFGEMTPIPPRLVGAYACA